MDDKKFQKILNDIGDLPYHQFKELVKAYANKSNISSQQLWNNTVQALTEYKLAEIGVNSSCPYCDSNIIVHYGTTKSGIQKFRCQHCTKTFTRFSGTIFEKSRYSWDVWVELLKMVLNDDSLEKIQTVLQQDLGCEGINLKTVFNMRLKLIAAMANVKQPKLSGVIQCDESFIRESQKGQRTLVSYIKGIERTPRYGRKPSKLGTLGAEFATILTFVDNRGFCVCKVASLGKAPVDAVIDLCENYCIEPAYLCSDANSIYTTACDLLQIPHYVRPSNYSTVIESAGYIYNDTCKTAEEIKAHNLKVLENLYHQGMIDYIENREDLTYKEFNLLMKTHHLNLARVNELHSDIKLMIEKKMTNVSTKYLQMYMDFFSFRRNWKVEYGRNPANKSDAENILKELAKLKINFTTTKIAETEMTLPKPSGRSAQILKEQTEAARKITANKYFKFDAEDVPNFNTREILLDAPPSRLKQIAKVNKIKGYTTMTQWALATSIAKLPDIEKILIELITQYRHYMIADEDIQYLHSVKYASKKDID